MVRLLKSAFVLSVAAVCGPLLWAQGLGVGCDGPVTLKAAKSGPCSDLTRQIATLLTDPKVTRAHWGIMVTSMDGAPIYSLNEGQFFQPASNTKLFTTAAAMALLGEGTTYETRVVAKGTFDGVDKLTGDLVLVGEGDANLSGRDIPYVAPGLKPKSAMPAPDALRYLEGLADQVAKSGLKVVNGDVVGDDTLFPWEPYAQDWSIDDTVWGYGAPVSALTINDNQIRVTVTPGRAVGEPATVMIDPTVPYYRLEVSVTTGVRKSGSSVEMERALGSKVLRIYGSIGVDSQPDVEEVAIHDPAEYGAVALKGMLEERGVVVTGVARASHVLPNEAGEFLKTTHEPLTVETRGVGQSVGSGCSECARPLAGDERVLASHRSVTLAEDVVVTNKVSQNLHAELMLHHLGLTHGLDGSTAQGARVIRAFLEKAGVDKDDFVFFDGSGLSGHDLVTPRATARLLLYASTQPWFVDWKRSLPVGGQDGSLLERFPKAPVKDHVFAKTGTLGEARALSGYLEGVSGRTVIFSIMVGNYMPQTKVDREVMDKIVGAIAAAN
jgi:D-alanyl-D-alanine carboxypeptidase/D-alanyl-D-alanine-endopeptidase (penicillin-binding protein 4)